MLSSKLLLRLPTRGGKAALHTSCVGIACPRWRQSLPSASCVPLGADLYEVPAHPGLRQMDVPRPTRHAICKSFGLPVRPQGAPQLLPARTTAAAALGVQQTGRRMRPQQKLDAQAASFPDRLQALRVCRRTAHHAHGQRPTIKTKDNDKETRFRHGPYKRAHPQPIALNSSRRRPRPQHSTSFDRGVPPLTHSAESYSSGPKKGGAFLRRVRAARIAESVGTTRRTLRPLGAII